MTLIVMTVAVIVLFIAVLAIYLFVIGVLLNRIADNLDDCSQNLRRITTQANVISPGLTRINKTGADLLGALPLLLEGADGVAAKLAPAAAAPGAAAADVPAGVGYMDAR